MEIDIEKLIAVMLEARTHGRSDTIRALAEEIVKRQNEITKDRK